MTLSRRTALKLGAGAGVLPFLLPARVSAGCPLAAVPTAGTDVIRARPLPIPAVRLTGGPLRHAQDMNGRYLLELEPDRMLAYYRERAGLARKAEPYGGWDGGGRNLTGHIAGHYLSGVSLMWAATGDARYKERADYIVAELKEAQDAQRDGYLGALEGGRDCFERLARGEIRSASFDLNGQWAPWYTLHKTYAGLRDAYRHVGNRTALEVEIAFAGWAEKVLAGLNDAQLQHMMNTEFGGMNEILVDLFVDTGDRRWLDLSYKFEHRAFIQPLRRQDDNLNGKHGNTAVPKLIGSAARFIAVAKPADLLAAGFFWDRVAHHHSFASGGHGRDEYFGPPDKLSDRVDGRTAETCNIYNMLKLTRQLFSLNPDPIYADFHERALYNHILASMDPEDGRTCYMVPVGRAVQREYQDMHRSFTCCVGSGMESHALHAHGLYYESGDRFWVAVYAPSTADWAEAGVRLRTETGFPEGETATLRLALGAPRAFKLMLRRPHWAGEGFQVKVNGEVVRDAPTRGGMELQGRSQYEPAPANVSTFVEIARTWRDGDTVEVSLPKSLRLEPTPDNPRRASVLWGPIVLAGNLGPEIARGPNSEDAQRPVAPVLVGAERAPGEWIEPAGEIGRFRTVDAGREPNETGAAREIELQPFYRLHRRTYATYWDLFTPPEWEARKAEYAAEAEKKRRLEAATVAYVEPGELTLEERFAYQGGEGSEPARILGRPGRRAQSWFSYELPVDPAHPLVLLVTHFSDDRRSVPGDYEILMDGTRIGEAQVDRTDPPRFFDIEFTVPRELVAGKEKVTLRFQARPERWIATVFAVRLVRAGQPR